MEMKKRALVSVSDKAGVVEFCKGLVENGFEIISTGGTAKALKEAGLEVIGISDITGFPECLDGRVKTLHPNVHAGLLAMRSNSEHMAQLEQLNINTIDIVCVNLYPFKATLESGADFATCIENIDIGGPSMLRSASKTPAVVACKHANPCGVGTGESVFEAYMRAYNSDPVSVFGGILAINGTVDEVTATEINKIFIEIVIASAYTCGALEILESKKNIRLLQIDDITARREKTAFDMKKVYGGLLVQEYDESLISGEDLSLFTTPAPVNTTVLDSGKEKTVYGLGVVTERAPTQDEIEALLFNWKVVKHTKSNAIVIGKKDRTTGIGMGQTNRIWAAQQAISHAGGKAKGSVMASDAFFPFPDCVEECVKAGITAIIQPGGSIRDKDSVDACNAAGIAMVFVGDRHFKH